MVLKLKRGHKIMIMIEEAVFIALFIWGIVAGNLIIMLLAWLGITMITIFDRMRKILEEKNTETEKKGS